MPNAGYPDDDGSRSPSGQHDLGRQRVSIRDVCATTMAANIAEQQMGTRINNRTDSAGDQRVPYCGLVDGIVSDDYNTAAYPPRPEDPNAVD